jgi:Xaa-Pro dipeptidase
LRIRLGKKQTTPASTTSDNNSDKDKDKNIDRDSTRRHVVVLRGGQSSTRYDTDHEPVFRQESYFWWLTGIKEPDCALVMVVDDCGSNLPDGNSSNIHRYALFVPRLPASYATIMGKIRSLDEWKELYGVDGGVYFADTLEEFVEAQLQNRCNARVLLMCGPNSDSGATYEARVPSFPGLSQGVSGEEGLKPCSSTAVVDKTTLFPILADCRVFKSHPELALMEHVTMITSFAHAYVMRNVRPGMAEYQCESLFKHYAYYNYGSRLVAYTSICGCGPNAAILHYGHTGEPNARRIEAGDHCLVDMVRKNPGIGWDGKACVIYYVCLMLLMIFLLRFATHLSFGRARNTSATPPT